MSLLNRRAPATLIIAFNRPMLLRRVLEATLAAQPVRLYVAIDGPREEIIGEKKSVEECRTVALSASARTKAFFRFREKNFGCRRGVIDAIDWFLEHEPEGVILEDDCLPGEDFFRFAGEMLDRYRSDPRVMSISGHGVLRSLEGPSDSYALVRTPMVWGWATWRRAWARFDRDGSQWEAVRDGGWVRQQGRGYRDFERHWRKAFENAREVDTWDYTWTFSSWVHEGLSIIPYRNLVANIGFGDGATHTIGEGKDWYGLRESMTFPLRHPPEPMLDEAAERHIQRTAFGLMRPLWDPRRLRSEVRRAGAAGIGRSRRGAAWLERRRAAMRAGARR